MSNITLTDAAAKRVAEIIKGEAPDTVLRISVAGGGCSGFQYQYDLVQEPPQSDDLVLAKLGATILIDSLSQTYMAGSEIDFVNELIGASFQIKNPNAISGCGCGESFAL